MAIRVVLAEDDYLVREAVVHLLSDGSGIEVVALASELETLRTAVAQHDPDVVVTDIRMPPAREDEGIRIASDLRQSHPRTGVVILSQYAEPRYVLELLDAGSARRAYLLKDRIHDGVQLRDAVRTVHEGGSLIDPRLVEVLVRNPSNSRDSPLARLTPRELETLGEVAQGKSNEAIAASLFLTKRAVEKHINSIFAKLDLAEAADVSRRVKATLVFLAESRVDQAPHR